MFLWYVHGEFLWAISESQSNSAMTVGDCGKNTMLPTSRSRQRECIWSAECTGENDLAPA